MHHRTCVFSLAIGLMLLPALAARVAAAPARPNILFLFTDDQQEHTLRALGNPLIQTPNLDKLVQQGFVFQNAYCMGGYSPAVCLPARQMTLSGRAWFAVRNLPPDAPNFPKSMNHAGYVTYHYGKRGNTAVDIQAQFQHNQYLNDLEDRTCGYPGRTIANDVIQFLTERQKAQASEPAGARPFCMYLAFANPHDPRVAAPEFLNRYAVDQIPLPPNFRPFHPFDNGELLVRDERLAAWPRPEANIRSQIRDYYAVITALDEQIGRIVQCLHEVGEYDNTLIAFSTDQGIALGSHGLMGKQNLYEPSMGIPLVFSGPGVPRGKSSQALAYIFDIYPTLCELAGVPIPAALDGKSLAPIIRGQADQVWDSIFLAYRDVQRAVRQGPWKLIRYPQINRVQLFNLQSDPHETRDLSADPAQADRIRQMTTLMEQQQQRFGDTLPLVAAEPKPGDVDLAYYQNAPPPATKKPGAKRPRAKSP